MPSNVWTHAGGCNDRDHDGHRHALTQSGFNRQFDDAGLQELAAPGEVSSAALPHLPSSQARPNLNLTDDELVEASGGYLRPADQIKALHARGFVRAWRNQGGKGKVILERAHYEAVVRGQFGAQPATNEPGQRQVHLPDRAAFRAKFASKNKA